MIFATWQSSGTYAKVSTYKETHKITFITFINVARDTCAIHMSKIFIYIIKI